MDPGLVESLRILKRFFDDVHRKLPNSVDETLLCLTLDHVLCLFNGLRLLYDFEDQPYDAENITNADQSKFYYELRCLLNYAVAIKHLKLVPGECANLDSESCIDLGDLTGMRTLEVKGIRCSVFRGLNVICKDLESVVFNRSQVPSIELILLSLKMTRSKRSLKKNSSQPNWNNLRILKLRNNRINNIDQSISLASNLEVLDLSYNSIRSSDVSLGVLQRLESLFLNYNSLTSLSGIISPNMNKLVQLSVSYNLLQSLEGLEGLASLRELDVSYNLIMFPMHVRQLKSLKKLEKLDITGNPLCLDKNFRSSVIMKLHPAVIDYIIFDGRRLTRGEKKMFIATLDSPENPIPVAGVDRDMPSQSIRSTNKKKARIISEIPDQTNFQDDEDFLVSNSFHERVGSGMMSRDDIIDHFQATHEHFKPDVPRQEANLLLTKNPAVATLDDDDDLLRRSESQMKEGVDQETIKLQQQQQQTFRADQRMELSSEGLGGVQMKVEAVIESSKPDVEESRSMQDGKDDVCNDDDDDDDDDILEESLASEEMFATVIKVDKSAALDTTLYFDSMQSFASPSIDRSLSLLEKSRLTVCNPDDFRTPRCSFGDSSEPRTPTADAPSYRDGTVARSFSEDSAEEKVGRKSSAADFERPFFHGMTSEEQGLLLKDLSDEDTKYNVLFPGNSAHSHPLSCVVRDHWLFVVRGDDLPTLKVEEHFDLRSILKVSRVRGQERQVRVEFDTIRRSRRQRVFQVEGGDASFEEFFGVLVQFVEVTEQKMLECLKCEHVFLDESSSTSLHSSEPQLRSLKVLDKEKEKQCCPSCSSTMVVESPTKPRPPGVRSGQGTTNVLDLLSKQLQRKEFGQIEDLLNRSLTSEMGYIEPTAASDLTSSGTFQTRRAGMTRFIDRGIIGDDEEVNSYVDEEGQEAM